MFVINVHQIPLGKRAYIMGKHQRYSVVRVSRKAHKIKAFRHHTVTNPTVFQEAQTLVRESSKTNKTAPSDICVADGQLWKLVGRICLRQHISFAQITVFA